MIEDICPSQLRAARALIGWTRDELAAAAGTTTRTLARLEAGETVARPATIAAIRSAFEKVGVVFIPNDNGGVGVRFRE